MGAVWSWKTGCEKSFPSLYDLAAVLLNFVLSGHSQHVLHLFICATSRLVPTLYFGYVLDAFLCCFLGPYSLYSSATKVPSRDIFQVPGDADSGSSGDDGQQCSILKDFQTCQNDAQSSFQRSLQVPNCRSKL